MSRQYMRLVHKKDLTVDDTGRLLIEDLAQAYMTGHFILTRQERAELMRHTSINWQALYSAMTTARDRYTKAVYVMLLDLKEFELNSTRFIYENIIDVMQYGTDLITTFDTLYAERLQWRYRQIIGLEICAKYMSKISKVKNILEAIAGINNTEEDEEATQQAKEKGFVEGDILPSFNNSLESYKRKLKSNSKSKDFLAKLEKMQPLFCYSDKVKIQTYRALCKCDNFNFANLLLETDYNEMQEKTEELLDKYHKQEQRKQ